MPDAGGRWRSMWTQTSKTKFRKNFNIVREVIPGSPSPRKPHINTGIRSNTISLSQQPLWGGFGVDSSSDPQQARPTSHDLITSKCKMGCTSTCRSDTTTCRSAPRSIAATNRSPPEPCPSGGRHPCCERRSSPSSSPSGRPAQPRQGSIRQSE